MLISVLATTCEQVSFDDGKIYDASRWNAKTLA